MCPCPNWLVLAFLSRFKKLTECIYTTPTEEGRIISTGQIYNFYFVCIFAAFLAIS